MPSQSQNVTIDARKLAAITQMAEEGRLCENSIASVLRENDELHQQVKNLQETQKNQTTKIEKLTVQRNRYRFIVAGIALAVAGGLVLWLLRLRKPFS